ncbi:hypothetical protein AWC38_SpisGene22529 [Stylophora pistillata]|uniref:Uncharacterized protein n=1 Tax=Stylophora pistillata TaxID=50429 RepID=A0A2B4RA70_STYPI|nr:hypothetical protein AWC38_SpisGene22529 [Stylophora pistillata]
MNIPQIKGYYLRLLINYFKNQHPPSIDNSALANSFADFFINKIDKIHSKLVQRNIIVGPSRPIPLTCPVEFNNFREHLAKSVSKKLSAVSKEAGCTDLSPWIPSIMNHLWWCAESCNKDAEVQQEKWLSVIHHVRNRHSWLGIKHFHKCDHQPLSREQQRTKKWLKTGSAAHTALVNTVKDKLLLKDLLHLTKFVHTTALEVCYSMYLKYLPKLQLFSHMHDVMKVGTMLAALDHNFNANRPQLSGKYQFVSHMPWADGGCHHIAAALFDLEASIRFNDLQSCTSGQCMWKKKGKKNEGSLPIQDLQTSCCGYAVTVKNSMKPRDFNPLPIPYDPTVLEQQFKTGEKVTPTASKEMAIKFLESITFNEEQAEMINKETVNQPQSQFWFDQRAERITVSSFYTVCHLRESTDRRNTVKHLINYCPTAEDVMPQQLT